MKLILLTGDTGLKTDRGLIRSALDLGFFRVHVRVYGSLKEELKSFLDGFGNDYLKRLVIHEHYELRSEYELGGIHFPAWKRKNSNVHSSCKSTSIHSVDELLSDTYDYAFLGPVYDSISKTDYKKNSSLIRNRESCAINQVYAIGGVTCENLSKLKEAGFKGAGILGSVWNSSDPVLALKKFARSLKQTETHG